MIITRLAHVGVDLPFAIVIRRLVQPRQMRIREHVLFSVTALCPVLFWSFY